MGRGRQQGGVEEKREKCREKHGGKGGERPQEGVVERNMGQREGGEMLRETAGGR